MIIVSHYLVKINSHILTDELNKKPTNSKEVTVTGATLYKIKNGKVTNCYSTLETITDAFVYLVGMLQFGTLKASYRFFIQLDIWQTSMMIILMLIVEYIFRYKQHGLQLTYNNIIVRYTIYIVLLVLLVLYCGENETFIYFQF